MEAKVYAVRSVQTTTTRSRPPFLVIHAQGLVPSVGWSAPRLVPWIYIVPPPDGLWDFDFLATRPEQIVTPVITPIEVRFTTAMPAWCKGVRIHAVSNMMASRTQLMPDAEENTLMAALESGAETVAGYTRDAAGRGPGDAWPWVFPVGDMAALAEAGGCGEDALAILLGKSLRATVEGENKTGEYNENRLDLTLSRSDRRIVEARFG